MKVLWSAFKCIETGNYFKAAIKKSTLIDVVLLSSMSIEVGFDQCLSKNGINFKIICRYSEKIVFKDPDDSDDNDEGFVLSFATPEDTILSL